MGWMGKPHRPCHQVCVGICVRPASVWRGGGLECVTHLGRLFCAGSWRGHDDLHDGDDSTVVDMAGVSSTDKGHQVPRESVKSDAYVWLDLQAPWCDRPVPWIYWESTSHNLLAHHESPVSVLLSLKHCPMPVKGMEAEAQSKQSTCSSTTRRR